ncbi:c-type cytochrome [Phyllobacterium sp. K27]
MPSHWIRTARVLGVTGALIVVAGGLFIWSGIYNVAASADHLGVTTWLLEKVRDQSVATQSRSVKVPPTFDNAMVLLGAAHYEGGCVPCHNRPGAPVNAVVAGMLPAPPDLAGAAPHRPPAELFWIVKHGLKYTGMPAWPSIQRDDEIWALVAFLNSLPISDKEYSVQAGLSRLSERREGGRNADTVALTQCSRCHDSEGFLTNGSRIPRLAGLPHDYIARTLHEYARAIRPSGIMQPVAELLDDREIEQIAAYYAALPSPGARSAQADEREQMHRGAELAKKGAASQDLPACQSCHSPEGTGRIPPLAGQHADYLELQLDLFRKGERNKSPYGRVMTTVARRMTDQQIADVSRYFSSLERQGRSETNATEKGPS